MKLCWSFVNINLAKQANNHHFKHSPILNLKSEKSPIEAVHYIHGWQQNPSNPESLHYQNSMNELIDFSIELPKIGYSVNMLSWHEHAVTLDVRKAQDKLWQPSSRFEKSSKISVIDLLENQYLEYINAYPKIQHRIAGHSLGSQAALKLTYQIIKNHPFNKDIWPQRVALLDPAFMKGNYDDYQSKNSLELCLEYIDELKRNNIAVECYRSSIVSNNWLIGLSNSQLIGKVPFVDIRSPHLAMFDLVRRHMEAKYFYFQSFKDPPQTISPHAQLSKKDLDALQNTYFDQEQIKSSSFPPTMKFYKKKIFL